MNNMGQKNVLNLTKQKFIVTKVRILELKDTYIPSGHDHFEICDR